MTTQTETPVIFRTWPNGDILALFPTEPGDSAGNCLSYEHTGQHSAADYYGCIDRTRPADDAEFAALFCELTATGYRLQVRRRATAAMHWTRYHAINDSMLIKSNP